MLSIFPYIPYWPYWEPRSYEDTNHVEVWINVDPTPSFCRFCRCRDGNQTFASSWTVWKLTTSTIRQPPTSSGHCRIFASLARGYLPVSDGIDPTSTVGICTGTGIPLCLQDLYQGLSGLSPSAIVCGHGCLQGHGVVVSRSHRENITYTVRFHQRKDVEGGSIVVKDRVIFCVQQWWWLISLKSLWYMMYIAALAAGKVESEQCGRLGTWNQCLVPDCSREDVLPSTLGFS